MGRSGARLVDASFKHIDRVHADARRADKVEIWRASGREISQALEHALTISAWSQTLMYGRKPVGMFGVAPLEGEPGAGVPWAVGTFHVEHHPRPLLEVAPGALREMLRLYPKLVNAVDAENHRAIRFLAWLGFTISRQPLYSPSGAAFLPFHMITEGEARCATQRQLAC